MEVSSSTPARAAGPGAAPARRPVRPLAARMRPRSAGRGRRPASTCSAPGTALRAAHRARPAALDGAVRTAGLGQDDARADRRPAAPTRRFEELSAVRRAGPRCARVHRARPRSAARAGRAHGAVPRRDPPLQQGPAGRAAARRRGGARHADRRDDREPATSRSTPRCSRRAPVYELQRSRRGDVERAAAPGARPRAADGTRRRGRARVPGRRARAATRAPRSARSSSPARRRGRRPRHARGRRGRAAAPRACATTRPATSTTTRSQRLDQGHARLGPRRLAVLPRGDDRGRRGPALHRPADGDPGHRGRRQRRPAGAGRRRRRRAGRRARRAARGPARAGPGRDLPRAGAEVQRRLPRHRRRARARPRATGRRRRPCARRLSAQPLRARLRGLRLPSRQARAVSPQPESCPRRSGRALLDPRPDEPEMERRHAEIRRLRGS